MRIVLFDWTTGGHHALYLERFAKVLSRRWDITVAIPDETADALQHLPVKVYRLGRPRPSTDFTKPLAPQNRTYALTELDLFERVAKDLNPDHLVHLYADPIIRQLVKRRDLGVPTILTIFFPRAHYPTAYGTSLPPNELLKAWFLEYLVGRWKRRRDAHALFTLDEYAARRWSAHAEKPSVWLPEPPVSNSNFMPSYEGREGCLLYGVIAARKGIDLLCRSVTSDPASFRVIFAGPIERGFEAAFAGYVSKMKESGASVESRAWVHDESEGLAVLARARCAVLPYPLHNGMSRVLLEACSARTPVVVHNRGLLGHLVRSNGLGYAVDCTEPWALNQAIRRLCAGSEYKIFEKNLARFGSKFSDEAFERAIITPFHRVATK